MKCKLKIKVSGPRYEVLQLIIYQLQTTKGLSVLRQIKTKAENIAVFIFAQLVWWPAKGKNKML